MDESNVKIGSIEELLGGLFGDQPAPEPEPVAAIPTMTGAKGRAWQADLRVLREAAMTRHAELGDDNLVALWLIEAPEASSRWHSYCLSLVSLSGKDETYVTGATHEFSLAPVAPIVSRDDMLTGLAQIPIYGDRGPIFAAQITVQDHAAAIEKLAATVQEVCNGDLIPDYDADSAWVERFGDTNVDPAFVERERKEKAVQRYMEAMKGLEVAAAYAAAREPRNVLPTFLRSGIDSTQISIAAIVRTLVKAGVIKEVDYFEAAAITARDEYANYAARLSLPPLSSDKDETDAHHD